MNCDHHVVHLFLFDIESNEIVWYTVVLSMSVIRVSILVFSIFSLVVIPSLFSCILVKMFLKCNALFIDSFFMVIIVLA